MSIPSAWNVLKNSRGDPQGTLKSMRCNVMQCSAMQCNPMQWNGMYVRTYVCVYVHVYAWMNVWMYACMHVYMRIMYPPVIKHGCQWESSINCHAKRQIIRKFGTFPRNHVALPKDIFIYIYYVYIYFNFLRIRLRKKHPKVHRCHGSHWPFRAGLRAARLKKLPTQTMVVMTVLCDTGC